MNATSFIPCANNIHLVEPIIWTTWKERLLAERLGKQSLM
ncbi:MAG: hypothetical protein WDM71_05420 [Ferruginibacter sp.]